MDGTNSSTTGRGWYWVVVALALLAAGCAAGPPPKTVSPEAVAATAEREAPAAVPVLRSEDLRPLHLEMDPRDAEVLFRKDPFDMSSFPVTLIADGKRHHGRVEVMGSFSRRFPKKSILVKLNKDEKWRGERRVALDAMATDGSLMRERLAWETIHALGMVAPEVRYRTLHINGDFIGVFLHTEWIEPDLFASHGLGADGQFFHPVDEKFCGDLRPVGAERAGECWAKLAPGDDNYHPLVELSRRIEETPIERFDEFLDRHFVAESVINWLVVNTLTSDGDTYNKNYFLYRSEHDGRWTVVPWDYDLTFGRNFDAHQPFPGNVYNDHFVYYYPPQLGAYSPLKMKALRNPEIRRRFLRRLRHLMGMERDPGVGDGFGLWEPAVMGRQIERFREALRTYVPGDRYSRLTVDDFDREVGAVRYYTLARWLYLQTKMFGDFPWDADAAIWDPVEAPPPPPLPSHLYVADAVWDDGPRLALVADGYGYVLALLEDIDAMEGSGPLRFSAEVDMNQVPAFLPAAAAPEQCVQRTWFIALKTPARKVSADLTLEYLQENSRRNELGAAMSEAALDLWMYDGQRWHMLPADANTKANTLKVSGLGIPDSRLLRFVACSGARASDRDGRTE